MFPDKAQSVVICKKRGPYSEYPKSFVNTNAVNLELCWKWVMNYVLRRYSYASFICLSFCNFIQHGWPILFFFVPIPCLSESYTTHTELETLSLDCHPVSFDLRLSTVYSVIVLLIFFEAQLQIINKVTVFVNHKYATNWKCYCRVRSFN